MNMLNGIRTVTAKWPAYAALMLLLISAVAVMSVYAEESDGDTSASLSYTQSSEGLNVITYGPLDTTYSRAFITIEDETGPIFDSGMGTYGEGYLIFVLNEELDENGFYTISIGKSLADSNSILNSVLFVNGDVSIDSVVVDTAMEVGDTDTLSVTTTPATLADVAGVTYASDKPDVVSVTDDVVTAESKGTATITATIEVNGTTISKTVEMTVGDGTVGEPTVTGIEIAEPPSKTVYTVGDELVLNGLAITAHYSDGTSAKISYPADGLTVGQVDMGSAGSKTVTVSYEGMTAEFTITVNEREPGLELKGIAVTGAKTEYFEGDLFTVEGMTVTATYSDGSHRNVTGYTWTPSGALTVDDGVVTISYTENGITVTAQVEITVEPVVADGIVVVPGKNVYEVDEPFVADVEVYFHLSNGAVSETPLADGEYTVDASNVDTSKPGLYTVTVSYTGEHGNFETTYPVHVRAPGQVAITVNVLNGGLFGGAVLYWEGDTDGHAVTIFDTVMVDEGAMVTLYCDGLFSPTVMVGGQMVSDIENGYTFTATGDVTITVMFPADDDDDDEPVNPPVVTDDGGDDSTAYIVAIAAAAVVAILAALILMQTRKS